ncbi:microtubule-associated protein futsch isoform X2 [Aethina tumida]|uniref:microtubule-associated protein futsch isoform X2 n=1 Tax=Aethina tumida TaxID=116153 RepID=UPI002147D722|nr:microtubule-associated protein futsch isoform X2 [Aethina tumida]
MSGLLSWDVNDCLVDLEKELAIITEQALEGEEARYGERLIQFASENLVTEILIHPVVSTLAQCVRNLLSSFTRHRHIIHAGYTFAANGSWALQDGTFSLADFSEAFQEIEVQRVIRAYENGISLDLHCSPEGDWNRLSKEPFARSCKLRVNPNDVLNAGSPAITSFMSYISPFLVPTSLENLLESSDVVGNIRFSRPTLYVFPGGQGDAALFGINGFNMLLDGGYSRKACFWDFVRHLDRLDAVLMTRLNNGNVNGLSAVLKRKKQDAVYPQIGHFFCNIIERKTIMSPDGDKDKDPLLINLIDEGQEIISNLRHLSLNPQVCYRDSEPINLYHKVGHGTLDMYVLSPAKDSKEVREFLMKWNHSDQKLFANQKHGREFTFPIQNLVSICALLVWQPANPNDTITRILYPGSSPQKKIFEGLDRLKQLECIKHPVCSEKSLSPVSIIKSKQKETILDKVVPTEKPKVPLEKKEKPEKIRQENKLIENNIKNGDVNGVIQEKPVSEKVVKKSESTDSEKSAKGKKQEEAKLVENGDKLKQKPKTENKPPKARAESQQRRKPTEKKASPTTPKKSVDNKTNGEVKPKTVMKPSPSATPAKSTKDANNRRVIESKKAAPKRESAPSKPSESKPKVERKPISRRPKETPKAPISPVKKMNGVHKPDSISKRGKLDKEGTTDSSTVSTPSADQESILKKDLSKLTPEEIQQLKAKELADLKEEQEAVKEIEAVFKKGEKIKDDESSNLRKIKDISIDDKMETEEYLIIEKEEIEHDSLDEKDTKEDETQKLARDSEESEKQRKLSDESVKIAEEIKEMSNEISNEKIKEITKEVTHIVEEAADIVKSKEASEKTPEDKLEVSVDKKELEDEVKEVAQESQPDEKCSANIESGATTTAPTLPEDERIPLDDIKEDNGQVVEEKHIKEDTKEKDIPVIQLPPKSFDNVSKLPSVVGIRLDKQAHIRDIVKTPDEVADLPVHEEVDIAQYNEYTHELKTTDIPEKTQEPVSKEYVDARVMSDQEKLKALTENVIQNEAAMTVDILRDNEKEMYGALSKDKENIAQEEKEVCKKELTKSPDEEKDKDEHEQDQEKQVVDSKLISGGKVIEDETTVTPIPEVFKEETKEPSIDVNKLKKKEEHLGEEQHIEKAVGEEIERKEIIQTKEEETSSNEIKDDKEKSVEEDIKIKEEIIHTKEKIEDTKELKETKEKLKENEELIETKQALEDTKDELKSKEEIIDTKEEVKVQEELKVTEKILDTKEDEGQDLEKKEKDSDKIKDGGHIEKTIEEKIERKESDAKEELKTTEKIIETRESEEQDLEKKEKDTDKIKDESHIEKAVAEEIGKKESDTKAELKAAEKMIETRDVEKQDLEKKEKDTDKIKDESHIEKAVEEKIEKKESDIKEELKTTEKVIETKEGEGQDLDKKEKDSDKIKDETHIEKAVEEESKESDTKETVKESKEEFKKKEELIETKKEIKEDLKTKEEMDTKEELKDVKEDLKEHKEEIKEAEQETMQTEQVIKEPIEEVKESSTQLITEKSSEILPDSEVMDSENKLTGEVSKTENLQKLDSKDLPEKQDLIQDTKEIVETVKDDARKETIIEKSDDKQVTTELPDEILVSKEIEKESVKKEKVDENLDKTKLEDNKVSNQEDTIEIKDEKTSLKLDLNAEPDISIPVNDEEYESDSESKETKAVLSPEHTVEPKDVIEKMSSYAQELSKIEEKMQELKEASQNGDKSETIKVDHKTQEEILHAEPVFISSASTPDTPKIIDPLQEIDKTELGRKSPKEREEDVIKIVTKVAEVLKSDAPLEEFEGKIPLGGYPYQPGYTTELRETHITTVESPIIESKEISTIPEEPICPKSQTASFLEEEKKISVIPEAEEKIENEQKRSSLIKESQELMMATSKIISDIKSKTEDVEEKVDDVEEKEDEDSGTVHRMLVTASSEDGGEEIEICPPGTITFSKSSESSGRSSPDIHSQKQSQKSSLVETISESIVTVQEANAMPSEKDSCFDDQNKSASPVEEKDIKQNIKDASEKSPELKDEILDRKSSVTDKVDEKIDVTTKEKADLNKSSPESSKLSSDTEKQDQTLGDKIETTKESENLQEHKSASPVEEKDIIKQDTKEASEKSPELKDEILDRKSFVTDKVDEKTDVSTKEKADLNKSSPDTSKLSSDTEKQDQTLDDKIETTKESENLPEQDIKVSKILSGKSSPDIIESKDTPKESLTTGKTPALSDNEKDVIIKSGKSSPNLVISKEGSIEKLDEVTKDEIKLKEESDDKTSVLHQDKSDNILLDHEKGSTHDSGKSSPLFSITKDTPQEPDHITDKSIPELPETKIGTTEITLKEELDKTSDLPADLKQVAKTDMQKDSPSVDSSGKTSPDIKKDIVFGTHSPDIQHKDEAKDQLSDKSTAKLVEKVGEVPQDEIKEPTLVDGKLSPEQDKDLSGKSTPDIKIETSKCEVVAKDILDKSGKSTPVGLDIEKEDLTLKQELEKTTEMKTKDEQSILTSDPQLKSNLSDLTSDKKAAGDHKDLSGKSTPDIKEDVQHLSGKITPEIKSGLDDVSDKMKDSLTTSKTPSGKSTPEIKDIDIKDDIKFSGKADGETKDTTEKDIDTKEIKEVDKLSEKRGSVVEEVEGFFSKLGSTIKSAFEDVKDVLDVEEKHEDGFSKDSKEQDLKEVGDKVPEKIVKEILQEMPKTISDSKPTPSIKSEEDILKNLESMIETDDSEEKSKVASTGSDIDKSKAEIVPQKVVSKPAEAGFGLFNVLGSAITDVFDKIEKTASDVKEVVSHETKELDDKIQQVVTSAEESKTNIEDFLDRKKSDIESALSEKVSQFDSQIKDTVESATGKLEEVGTKIESKIDDVKKDVTEKVSEIDSKIKDTVESATDKLEDISIKTETKIDSVKKNVEKTTSDITDALNKEKDLIESKISEKISYADDKIKDTIDQIDSKIEDVKNGAEKLQDTIKQDQVIVEKKVTELVSEGEEKLTKAADTILKEKDSVEDKIETAVKDTVDLKNKLSDSVLSLTDEADIKIKKSADSVVEIVDKLDSKTDKIKEDAAKATESVTDIILTEKLGLEEKVATTLDNLQEKTKDVSAKLNDSIKDKVEEIDSDFKQSEKGITGPTKVIEKAANIITSVVTDVESKVSDVKGITGQDEANLDKTPCDKKADKIDHSEKEADDIKSVVESIDHGLKKNVDMGSLSIDLKETKPETTKTFTELRDIVEKEHEKVSDIVLPSVSDMSKIVNGIQSPLDDVRESQSNICDLENKLKGTLENTDELISKVGDCIKTQIDSKKEELEQKAVDLKDSMAKTTENVQSQIEGVTKLVAEKVDSKIEDVSTTIDHVASGIKDDASKIKDTIAKETEQIEKSVTDTVHTTIETADKKLKDVKDSIESKRTEIEETVSERISEAKDHAKDKIDQAGGFFSGLISSVESKLDDIKKGFDDATTGLKDTISHVDEKEKAIDKIDSLLENNIDLETGDLKLKSDETLEKVKLDEKVKELKDESSKDQKCDVGDQILVNGQEEDKESINKMCMDKLESVCSKLDEKLDESKKPIEEKTKDFITTLSDKTSQVEEEIEGGIKTSLDKCEKGLTDLLKSVDKLEKKAAESTSKIDEEIKDKIIDVKKTTTKFDEASEMTKSIYGALESEAGDIKKIAEEKTDKVEKSGEHLIEEAKDIVHSVGDMAKSIFTSKSDEAEKTIEKSASDIADAFDTVTDMSKSVIFEKCGDSKIPPKELEEATKMVEKSADDLTETFEKITDMSKSVIFDKCDKKETVVEKTAKELADTFDSITDMSKSVIFEKCEKPEEPKPVEESYEKCDKFKAGVAPSVDELQKEKVGLLESDIVNKSDLKTEKLDDKGIECSKGKSDEHTLGVAQNDVKKLSISDVEISLAEMDPKKVSKDLLEQERQLYDALESAPGSSTQTLQLSKGSPQLSGKSTPDMAEHKTDTHILGVSTPPIVPVSPSARVPSPTSKVESKKPTNETLSTIMKEVDVRSSTPGSDDYEVVSSIHSDISSSQFSKAPYASESERIESDDDDDIPGSPLSITSQVAHSRSSSHYDFDEDTNRISKIDPMNMSFYGALPDDPETSDIVESDDKKAVSADLLPTHLFEITKAKFTSQVEDDKVDSNNQLDQLNKNGASQSSSLMTSSFMGTELPTSAEKPQEKDPIGSWGKPLGLPSPAPPNEDKGTPKKEKKLPPNVTAKNKLNDDKKRSESPSKYRKKLNPVYVDLTYVPHHGNSYYSYVDFFRRIRARYYVFSGIEPSKEVYNALLEAKQTWEDKDLEVTIIPTYDTDILGYWVAENEELLTKYKIDLSPSASRCTINLQDHETSCSAYRLEF